MQIFICVFIIITAAMQRNPKLAYILCNDVRKVTKSLEEMVNDYEDDKNSMLAISGQENVDLYEDFYEELSNEVTMEQSMNMIFFGPPVSFMRLDPETILHIFSHTKKYLIPINRVMLAWDILTDGKTAAFLQGREYLALGTLLNVVPEEELYYVNFGDSSVLNYFSKHSLNLHRRKYGILAAAYSRYFGDNWYSNSSQINDLGFILCGFSAADMRKISPETFTKLNTELLSKIEKCSVSQAKALYKIATHPDAYDKPYTWSSHEIVRLNALFTYISEGDISTIQLEAVPAISENVIKSMPQRKLQYFTKQQILRLNPKARKAYILRMQLRNSLDMSQITKRNYSQILSCIPVLYINIGTILLSMTLF